MFFFFLETLNLFTLKEATCFISTIIQVYQKSRSRIFPFLTFFLVYNSDSGHLSGYLDSVLHSPQRQCLVPTISLISRMINRRLDNLTKILTFRFTTAAPAHTFALF